MGACLWQIVYLEEHVYRRVFVPECSWVIICGKVFLPECAWAIVCRRVSGRLCGLDEYNLELMFESLLQGLFGWHW